MKKISFLLFASLLSFYCYASLTTTQEKIITLIKDTPDDGSLQTLNRLSTRIGFGFGSAAVIDSSMARTLLAHQVPINLLVVASSYMDESALNLVKPTIMQQLHNIEREWLYWFLCSKISVSEWREIFFSPEISLEIKGALLLKKDIGCQLSIEEKNKLYSHIKDLLHNPLIPWEQKEPFLIPFYLGLTEAQLKDLQKPFTKNILKSFFQGDAFYGVKQYQSYSHLTKTIAALIMYKRLTLLQKVLKKEKELNDVGYYCFYHAQMNKWGFQEDFTKELIHEMYQRGLCKKPLPMDFIFIQNPKKIFFKNNAEKSAVMEQARQEQKSMMAGRDFFEYYRLPNRLSVNAFLFGNQTNRGSCTMHYLLANANVNDYSINFYENVFEPLAISEEIYDVYKNKIQDLFVQHQRFFKHGRLLQIALPKNSVDKHVYIAKTGAYKATITSKRGNVVVTPSQLFNVLEKKTDSFDPHILDSVEFAMPLTQDYCLNPDSDIKIFTYDDEPVDHTAYKAYLAARKALVRDIIGEHKKITSSLVRKLLACTKDCLRVGKEWLEGL